MDARWIFSFVLIILTRKLDVDAHDCGMSEYIACKQEIQDLRQDKHKYYYASDNQTLVEMCRKQNLAVGCVNSFAKECLPEKEQAYFKKLVLGSDKFFVTFCFEDSALRKRYLQHSQCIKNISSKLDDCSQQYERSQKELDSSEDEYKILLMKTCCIYFQNIQCSSNVTWEACGRQAAEFVSDLLTLLSGTYLTDSCKPYSEYDTETCTALSRSSIYVPNMTAWASVFISFVIWRILK